MHKLFQKLCCQKLRFEIYCKTCNSRHHTMLHMGNVSNVSTDCVPSTSGSPPEQMSSNSVALTNISNSQTLLATAIVQIRDNVGCFHSCRCLLDAASQSHFISSSFAQRLGLSPVPIKF